MGWIGAIVVEEVRDLVVNAVQGAVVGMVHRRWVVGVRCVVERTEAAHAREWCGLTARFRMEDP